MRCDKQTLFTVHRRLRSCSATSKQRQMTLETTCLAAASIHVSRTTSSLTRRRTQFSTECIVASTNRQTLTSWLFTKDLPTSSRLCSTSQSRKCSSRRLRERAETSKPSRCWAVSRSSLVTQQEDAGHCATLLAEWKTEYGRGLCQTRRIYKSD